MTNSTTATKAASNGDTTEQAPARQREHGMNRLREDECYHLTGLITDCLDEAEHLVRKVHRKTSGPRPRLRRQQGHPAPGP